MDPTAWHDALPRLHAAWADLRPFMPMYANLMISALIPIYTGAYASLSRPSSAKKPDKKTARSEDDVEEEETEQQMEGLTPRDAIVFPIMSGIVLAGLYWLIKTYGAAVINLILGWYFAAIGVFSVGKLLNDGWAVVDSFLWPSYYVDQGKIWHMSQKDRVVVATGDGERRRSTPLPLVLGRIPLPSSIAGLLWSTRGVTKEKYSVLGQMKGVFEFKTIVTRHNVISAVAGTGIVLYATLVDTPWWLTNLQGFAVCYGALQLLSPTSFATGSLILSGLFAYDIWAVFFTPLMVTVAKNLDVPIKMVFPRPDEPSDVPGEPPLRSHSMLGLGDIVLPGIMIALALRFDLWRFYLRKQKRTTGVKGVETVEKAPYVPITGHWGDKLLLFGSRNSNLPAHLTTSFAPTYFTVSMIGYVVGMVTTLVAMNVMQHAQPALLYLVPGVLISLWGTGLVRGELGLMWQYDETITGEALDDEGGDASVKDGEKDKVDDESSLWSWLWAQMFGSPETKDDAPGKKKPEPTSEAKIAEKKKKTTIESQADEKSAGQKDDDVVFSIRVSRYKHEVLQAKSSTSETAVTKE